MPRQFEPPQSMRFKPEEVPAYIKAKTHHLKANEIKEPYLTFLERWRGFEYLYREVAPLTQKHDAFVFATEAGEADVICACLAQLSRPRIDHILALPDIGDLNVIVSRHNNQALIGQNELLQDYKITVGEWLNARKDLRFSLKANTIKGLHAISVLLLIVRAACDPKVKKTDNLVKEPAALEPANRLLRDCVVHLIEHFQRGHDEFFKPSFRQPPPTGRKV